MFLFPNILINVQIILCVTNKNDWITILQTSMLDRLLKIVGDFQDCIIVNYKDTNKLCWLDDDYFFLSIPTCYSISVKNDEKEMLLIDNLDWE